MCSRHFLRKVRSKLRAPVFDGLLGPPVIHCCCMFLVSLFMDQSIGKGATSTMLRFIEVTVSVL